MINFLKRIFSPAAPACAAAIPIPMSSPLIAVVPAAVAVKAAPAPSPVQTANGEIIRIPFNDIVARLPAALAPRPSAVLTGTYDLPVQTALEQLPAGAVRIRFDQLRQAAPAGSFPEESSLNDTLVDLPLPKILAGINPALLARRPEQKRLEVPAEVVGVFGAKIKSTPVPSVSILPVPPISVATPAPAIAAAPAQTADAVTIRLCAVYEFWPEAVRQEILQANLNNAVVAVPLNRMDTAMKLGRVAFTWGELTQWLDEAVAPNSPNREISLEFPLKVVAPLFLMCRAGSTAPKKMEVSEHIPNLFAGLGKPQVELPPLPIVSAPLPKPLDTLGESLGQPTKKEWSPQEITRQVNAFPGVAAGIIAMSDGLLVAGELPSPLRAETMAAFLPQIFGRLAGYAAEVQLSPISAVTLQAGQTPCAIFKIGALFLAVVGRPETALPHAQLQRLAGEMAKRSQ